jgi:hypothetical protein
LGQNNESANWILHTINWKAKNKVEIYIKDKSTWFEGFSFPDCLMFCGLSRNNMTAATNHAIKTNIILKPPFPSFPWGPGAAKHTSIDWTTRTEALIFIWFKADVWALTYSTIGEGLFPKQLLCLWDVGIWLNMWSLTVDQVNPLKASVDGSYVWLVVSFSSRDVQRLFR